MHTLDTLKTRHPDKIESWYKDSDGYWIDLHYGWQFQECHAVHEATAREVARSFKDVTPCACRECQTKGEEWEYYDVDTGKIAIGRKSAK